MFGARYLRARGRYHLATDHALTAISDLHACRMQLSEWGVQLPEQVPLRGDLTEAYARLESTAAPNALVPATALRGPNLPLLSEAERRVAELAARGHKNREISRMLYVTVSTVEQHLTRIYRKLGVNSREVLSTDLVTLATAAGQGLMMLQG